MRLPLLCSYFRGLILFLGVLLGTRGADLGSLLADLGSLLGVSFGSWEKGCRQQLKTSKTAPLCSARPLLGKSAGQKGPRTADGVLFLIDFLLAFYADHDGQPH